MKGNVVDLAIGVIIGAAFGKIVESLVNDIIMPMIGAVTGGLDFSNYFLPLSKTVTAMSLAEAKKQGAVLAWGNFLTIAMNFLIIAFILFLVVRGITILRKRIEAQPAADQPAPPRQEMLLAEIRDLLAANPESVSMNDMITTEKTKSDTHLLGAVSLESLGVPESGIVELFNYGRGRQGLIPLWVGEGDLVAPNYVAEAAGRSIASGETFYSFQGGIPELRESIARYMGRHYGAPFEANNGPFTPDRFSVTIGGIHALQIAVRLTCSTGSEVIVPTPAWPNFRGVVSIAGAVPVDVPMRLDRRDGAASVWTLNIDEVADAITPRTRALIINSPANPTGWTADLDDLRGLLAIARKHGLWIIADEIYGRIVYAGQRAPSFHDVIDPDDRVIFINTLSKNWAMTGLRLGWIETPPALSSYVANLIQYSTSGVAVPLQRSAAAALEYGEPFIARQLERFRRSRDILCKGLAATGKVRFADPKAAFYLFVAIDGHPDTRALAFTLVEKANVGVAPGSAFGRGGEDFVRICFARDPHEIEEATRRLVRWINAEA